ncbi:MAG TPA: hypothetical protein VFF79_07805 [Conexibacter sp.]|nr:hypothetical protein [Conexibacter sp.]
MWRRTAKRNESARLRWALPAAAAALAAATPAALPPAPARAQLPDGRRYELVSPSAKLGNDVFAESSRTRAAAGEAPGLPMAATFSSLGGFADVQGMGVSTEYIAQRTGQPGTSGWATHAITPPQQPMSLLAAAQGLDPLYEGDMAADLTRGIFRAWSPLTGAPNVQGVANLYAREDLRTPGAGAYRLLTSAATPLAPIASGTERPYLAGASRDFEHVIFESRLALTPDAAPGGNVMLYKADHGVVRLLAPGPGCPEGRAPAAPCSIAGAGATALRQTSRAISADGSRVAFASPVTPTGNVSLSATAPTALYQLDDRGTATTADDVTVQVNASEKSPPDAPQAATFQTASSDGERIFFTSTEQLTDTPGSGLYLWQRAPAAGAGHLTLIGGGAGDAAVVGASQDGHRVYFIALGQLVAGGPPVSEDGLYLWQDAGGTPGGSLSFVGAIGFADADANTVAFPWNQRPSVARVTPDGRELLFEVSDGSGLAPHADHGSCAGTNPNSSSSGRCSELYVYRADDSTPLAPDVVCASCDPAGGPATASALVNARDGSGASQVTWHLSRALSDDGRRVFFSTAQALVREDVNGRVDAYEYDVPSGTLHLLSSGHDAADAWFMDASASGDDVFFTTREQLVGWDTDQSYDLYDARVGGGFPEPPVAPSPCTGDACRGTAHAAPAVASLGSELLVGAGNPVAVARRRVLRCRRGFVKRRVHGKPRCVRVRRKPARRAKRRARRARRGRR